MGAVATTGLVGHNAGTSIGFCQKKLAVRVKALQRRQHRTQVGWRHARTQWSESVPSNRAGGGLRGPLAQQHTTGAPQQNTQCCTEGSGAATRCGAATQHAVVPIPLFLVAVRVTGG